MNDDSFEQFSKEAIDAERNGKLSVASERWEEAAQAEQKAGHLEQEAECWERATAALSALGEYDKAESTLKCALDIYRDTGLRRKELLCQMNLGRLQFSQGRFESALSLLTDVIVGLRGWGDEDDQAYCLMSLGQSSAGAERPNEARKWFNQARALFAKARNRDQEAKMITMAATTYGFSEPLQTIELLTEAARIYEELRRDEDVATMWASIAELYESAGKLERALNAWESARHRFRLLGKPREEASVWSAIGQLQRGNDEDDAALQSFGRAIELLKQVEDTFGQAKALAASCMVRSKQIAGLRDELQKAGPASMKDASGEEEIEMPLWYVDAIQVLGPEEGLRKIKESDPTHGRFGHRFPVLTDDDAVALLQRMADAPPDSMRLVAYDNLDQINEEVCNQLLYNLQLALEGREHQKAEYLFGILEWLSQFQERVVEIDRSLVRQMLEENQEDIVVIEQGTSPELHGTRSDGNVIRELLGRAESRIESGDLRSAIPDLEKVLEFCETAGFEEGKLEIQLELGQCYASTGRYDDARRLLRDAVKGGEQRDDLPGVATANSLLGSISLDRHDFEGALEWFKRAEQCVRRMNDPSALARALGNLGAVYLAQQRYPEAREHLEQAAQLKRSSGDKEGLFQILGNLAQLYESLGEREQANATRSQLEGLGNEHLRVLTTVNEASDLVNRGEAEKAVPLLMTARDYAERRGDPSILAKVLVNLAQAFRNLGKTDEARRTFAEAKAEFSKAGDAVGQIAIHATEAEMETRLGNHSEALKILNEVLEESEGLLNDQQQLAILSNVLTIQSTIGVDKKAQTRCADRILRIADRILEVEDGGTPTADRILALKAKAHVTEAIEQDYDSAAMFFERALELANNKESEDDPELLESLASAMRGAGRIAEAVQMHDRAAHTCRVRQDLEQLATVLLNRGTCLREMGDLHRAAESLRECLDLAMRDNLVRIVPLALCRLGLILFDLGAYEESLGLCERSAVLSHQQKDRRVESEALCGQAWHAVRDKRYDDAMHFAERSLQVDDGDFSSAEAHRVLATVHEDLGQMEEAGRHIEAALLGKAGPGVDRALRALYEGRLALSGGRYEEALIKLNDSLEQLDRSVSSPLTARLLLLRARAHEELGQIDKAITDYKQAVLVIERLTSGQHSEQYKVGINAEVIGMATRVVKLLLRHDDDPAAALEFLEKLKSRSLIERMSFSLTNPPDSLPEGIRTREANLRKRIRSNELLVYSARTERQRQRTHHELNELWRDYNNVLEEIAESHPEFADQRRGVTIAVHEIRTLLSG